jgi:hypothetical protein
MGETGIRRYTMDNGSVFDTSLARSSWEEDTYFDGQNGIKSFLAPYVAEFIIPTAIITDS